MTVYDEPLTEQEIKSCMIGNGRLQATIGIHLSEIITCNGIEGFDNLVNDFFPSLHLNDTSYQVVGSNPLSDEGDIIANGLVYIQVDAYTDV